MLSNVTPHNKRVISFEAVLKISLMNNFIMITNNVLIIEK